MQVLHVDLDRARGKSIRDRFYSERKTLTDLRRVVRNERREKVREMKEKEDLSVDQKESKAMKMRC